MFDSKWKRKESEIYPTFSFFLPLFLNVQRTKSETSSSGGMSSSRDHQFHRSLASAGGEGLYGGLPPELSESSHSHLQSTSSGLLSSTLASKLGLPLMPNPAPDVDLSIPEEPAPVVSRLNVEFSHPPPGVSEPSSNEPKRKKYAKEAWPGKKPGPSLLM